ncbi:TetR/AcrR family transcriptional regulator [Streptoalloteichus hindustanus]|uniref:Transcriptional regulator, TetR family n=1 Tax=Streptoalloteichus hindustanus TaxID=2017 RepID=A0A1M5ES72_STRHI|nr:TetR/AcrR family transcriptional regulator [Streptoalloteichus hindustanus]SHF82069.1 transcriptional regulator, TetR family [Streptoalloteichus hindustanus]
MTRTTLSDDGVTESAENAGNVGNAGNSDNTGNAEDLPGARRPGGRTARNRALVHEAVRAQLVEHGYDSLSVDTVAERSGVHRTTIYRRWRDVGGLLADVLDAARDDDWTPPDTGSLVGDLTAINREVHAALTETRSVTTALIAASFRSERAAAALHDFWDDRYVRCAAVVTRAVERGELAPGTDARRLLVAATAPLYHHVVLLRSTTTALLADQAARDAFLAATAGAFAPQEQ